MPLRSDYQVGGTYMHQFNANDESMETFYKKFPEMEGKPLTISSIWYDEDQPNPHSTVGSFDTVRVVGRLENGHMCGSSAYLGNLVQCSPTNYDAFGWMKEYAD